MLFGELISWSHTLSKTCHTSIVLTLMAWRSNKVTKTHRRNHQIQIILQCITKNKCIYRFNWQVEPILSLKVINAANWWLYKSCECKIKTLLFSKHLMRLPYALLYQLSYMANSILSLEEITTAKILQHVWLPAALNWKGRQQYFRT